MEKLHMAYRFSKINFEQWHKNSRIKVAFFFAFIICLMLTKSVLSFADSYGTSMQILEGFIWIMGSVINFVSLVINGSNLVRIKYEYSYQRGAYYYGYCKGAIKTNYFRK